MRTKLKQIYPIIKKDQGSIYVEAALIYPLILIVLFGLISATLVLHDHYVTEVSLEVATFAANKKVSKPEMLAELGKKRINNVDSLVVISSDSNDLVYNKYNEKRTWSIIDTSKYPLSRFFPFKMEETIVDYSNNPMPMIRQIDLIADIFDTVTLPNTIKNKYDQTLTSLFDALESY